MKILAINRRANFDYEILEKYEAGLVLFGHEVKSVKTGHINLEGSFLVIRSIGNNKLPEFFLINAYIPLYKQAAGVKNYNPERPRKALLKKNEISHLLGKKKEQGLTLVPLKIYTKRSFIKLEFGIGRGKKKIDKRETIKKREIQRQVRTLTKRQNSAYSAN
jgi:SsrA-binding protein